MRIKYFLACSAFFCCSIFLNAQPSKNLEALYADMAVKKDTALVNTLLEIGLLFRLQNNIDSSMYYFDKSLSLSQPLNYLVGICRSTYGKGDLYMYRENHDSAMSSFLAALLVTEKMPGDKRIIYEAKIKQRIAGFYLASEDGEKAIKYLQETEKLSAVLKDTSNLIDLGKDFVYCYGLKKDTVRALQYYTNGLLYCDLLEKTNTGNQLKMQALNRQRANLIRSAMDLFNNDTLFKDALVILEKIWADRENGIYNKRQVLMCLTHLSLVTGKPQKAIEYGNLVIEDLGGDMTGSTDIYIELAQAYYVTGQFKKAYDCYDLYFEGYKEKYESDKFSALADLETKYQTEKKEEQITALNKQKKSQRTIIGISIAGLIVALGLLVFALRANRLQKKLFTREKEIQKKELEQKMFELEQTALRAQMNPHFIFNSLNSVQRFVINNDAEGVNQYLTTFAQLIRQTLENSGKQLIPLKDELRYLETYLRLEQMRSNEKFRYTIKVDEDVDTQETFIPNMIIQPYLENSVIHGMAGKNKLEGLISLSVSKNGKLTCVVEDNGKGIEKSKLLQAETEKDHESMGTSITERRIAMFNSMNPGKIELLVEEKPVQENSSGTRVMIKFPLQNTDAG